MCNYGHLLQHCFFVEKNFDEAYKYYKMTSKLGHPTAWYHRGEFHEEGYLGEKNLFKAFTYYKKSADFGSSIGMNRCGKFLEFGFSCQKNLIEAMKYYKDSANKRNSDGQCNYGRSLELGFSGPKNVLEAEKYYKKSADLGNPFGSLIMVVLLNLDFLVQKIFLKQRNIIMKQLMKVIQKKSNNLLILTKLIKTNFNFLIIEIQSTIFEDD